MDIFGDFDDDMFIEKTPERQASTSVTLLVAEPGWFNEKLAPEGLELLRLKFIADRFYKEKRYAEAAATYTSAIEMCPPTNLGFLRDIVDGATRSLVRSSRQLGCSHDNSLYRQSLERLSKLEGMASCDDHRFSVATTRWLVKCRLEDLHTMIESESHSASLWRTLGERYQAEGKELFASCCFIKAAYNFRTSVHECRDRFRQENLAAARIMSELAAKITAARTEDAQVIDRITKFYTSLADIERDMGKSFEEYWFPPEEMIYSSCK